MLQTIQEQEYLEWERHPVTQVFKEVLNRWVDEAKTEWARGYFLNHNPHDMTVQNAKAVGATEIILKILELSYEDFREEENDTDD